MWCATIMAPARLTRPQRRRFRTPLPATYAARVLGVHTVSQDFSRRLPMPAAGARLTLITAFEQQGFSVTRAQGGVVEAHRDVRSLVHAKTPLRASALVVDDDGASQLHVHLAA